MFVIQVQYHDRALLGHFVVCDTMVEVSEVIEKLHVHYGRPTFTVSAAKRYVSDGP